MENTRDKVSSGFKFSKSVKDLFVKSNFSLKRS